MDLYLFLYHSTTFKYLEEHEKKLVQEHQYLHLHWKIVDILLIGKKFASFCLKVFSFQCRYSKTLSSRWELNVRSLAQETEISHAPRLSWVYFWSISLSLNFAVWFIREIHAFLFLSKSIMFQWREVILLSNVFFLSGKLPPGNKFCFLPQNPSQGTDKKWPILEKLGK